MSILTDQEISDVWYQCGLGNAYDIPASEDDKHYARAIEAAVIARLATVSVEPVAWGMQRPDGMVLDVIDNSEHNRHGGEYNLALYTAEALAAARVQGIDALRLAYEALETAQGNNGADGYDFEADKQYSRAMDAIRALIGGLK